MKHKTGVVTGANAGLGLATATALAAQGVELALLCRDAEKGARAMERIQAETGAEALHLFQVDLSSQRQIREVGAALLERFPHIDVLVNNAGTWFSRRTLTEDGIETVFAVNHLAYVLLTHVLYPGLRRAPEPRVVNVSSDNQYQGKIYFDDPGLSANYHGLRSYAQSKLGNMMFTLELHRRKPDAHLSVNAAQPGLVYTDIGLKHTSWLHGLAWKFRRGFFRGQTPAEGARTSIFLASDPAAAGQSGLYWENCRPKKPARPALDPLQCARLWELSLEMCGIESYFP
jgi:retinol dehydrogenase-12